MVRSLPTSLETQLCFALYSAMHAVGRAYGPLLDAFDLTYSQYLVMLVLWENDDIAVKQIGNRLFLDSGTLTPLLKRMEAAGLVTRLRDRDDERQVKVRLTDRGRAMQEDARSLPTSMACAMGQAPDQLETLRDNLVQLRTNLVNAQSSEAARLSPR